MNDRCERQCQSDFCNCGKLPTPSWIHTLLIPEFLIRMCPIIAAFLFIVSLLFIEKSQYIYSFGLSSAVAGWIFTSAVNMHSRIKQHTFDLIRTVRFSDRYIESVKEFNMHVENNCIDILSDDQANDIFHKDDYRKVRTSLSILFNIYELIAMAYYYGDVNRSIIKAYYKDAFLRFHKSAFAFAAYTRAVDPDAYEYFECLAKTWATEQGPSQSP